MRELIKYGISDLDDQKVQNDKKDKLKRLGLRYSACIAI